MHYISTPPLSLTGPQALYLIDCVKRNIPLPPALPPGQFPPVAGTVNISQMMVGCGCLLGRHGQCGWVGGGCDGGFGLPVRQRWMVQLLGC